MNKWRGLVLNLNLPAAQVARQIQQWLAGKRGPQLRPFAQIRQERGLSQERAALQAGYSESHLRAVEAGRSPLTQGMAAALARVYGCTVSDIARPPRRT